MEQDRFRIVKKRAARYMGQYDPAFVAEYMRIHCRGEAKEAVAGADRLMGQTFTFEDRWDMEPCAAAYTLEEMVWDRTPDKDQEWVYMLNRHEYLHKLLLAFYITGKQAYIDKLKWYLEDWIDSNPILLSGTETTRTIDTGIRCMSWQFLLLHLIGGDLIGREEAERILCSMSDQFSNMKNRYIGKYTLSNWGVLQTTAVCRGYMWFGEYLPDNGMEAWAWQELERQLDLQVMPDGSHWEQSIMYHIEVLLSCMKLLACPQGGVPRDKIWLYRKVEDMGRYVMHAAGPDHCQPAQCDSDVTDVRDILVKAAVLTGNGQFKFAGYESADLDSAWLLGRDGICGYGRLRPEEPQSRSLCAEDTGNLYVRSGWSGDSHYTGLQCGPLGSGHGHADMTHINLYYGGKPFLTDSGRYSYMEEEPLRPALKSAQAHNVCVIDGESHGIPQGSWSYRTYGSCLKNYYRESGAVHYCEMAYHGTLADNQNYLVIRRVMIADPGIWLIVNDIECGGPHHVKEYYHLDPRVQVREGRGKCGPESENQGAWELESEGRKLTLSGSREFRMEPCGISRKYNQLESAFCMIKETAFEGRHTDWTCLTGEGIKSDSIPVYQYGRKEPVPEPEVISRIYTLPSGEEWTFLIWNRETCKGGKLYDCGGVPVYGKAAAIHRLDGKTALYRLRN